MFDEINRGIDDIQEIADRETTYINQKVHDGLEPTNSELALLAEIIIQQNNLILTQNTFLIDNSQN